MSDVVIVALISSATAIVVALIPQIFPERKEDSAATNGDSISELKKENGALKKENAEKQEIIDYYRRRDGNK
ncbi:MULTISPECIES: hypothetical protein [Lactiplantibacillus]|uniref:hypothetical protein n=1 Tax=Lactiplantibacillus TaxID=2767842 RepID=UPI00217DC0B7|nr:hypothetical protein [Lactiplantibacillus plantarum]UWF30227.1 hypothetical protein NYR27_09285 [Lactiplantibacillus plantarum]UWF40333.1 hypothetical protein NYR28_06220 [Lactiplantibacillus plantarum]UWF43332.1 hypothetical protein NYR31_06230 [Lactiplantibacillus plantarum]